MSKEREIEYLDEDGVTWKNSVIPFLGEEFVQAVRQFLTTTGVPSVSISPNATYRLKPEPVIVAVCLTLEEWRQIVEFMPHPAARDLRCEILSQTGLS